MQLQLQIQTSIDILDWTSYWWIMWQLLFSNLHHINN